MNILPKFCKSNATVNYSILNRFKPANIYRFFCLSLSRDDWYNVRITLDELKRTSGGKSVSSFNKIFQEYLDIKPYFVDNGFLIQLDGIFIIFLQWKNNVSLSPISLH